jgi:hypothetical protein
MIGPTAVEQLNTVQYLYLRELSEPQDNSLKIIVEEAVINRSGVANSHPELHPELQAILKDASPIESVEGCRGVRAFLETLRRISGHGRIGRVKFLNRIRRRKLHGKHPACIYQITLTWHETRAGTLILFSITNWFA